MLAKLSVKKPYTIIVAAVLVIILGVVSFTEMTPDLLPSIDLPYAVVMTTYVGASPEEVEVTVTKPVEQSMATLNNINEINSVSSENMSLVMLEFAEGTNMDSMTIDMREKLDLIAGYWSDSIGTPMIMKINPDMLPVVVAAVDVEGMDTAQISDYVNNEILPQLEGLEGVASVSAVGLIEEQVNVVIRQDKIDKINEKLKNSVSSKLDEAESAMTDAMAELLKSKEELEAKNEEYQAGMLKADQGFSDGRIEIAKGEIAVENAQKELETKEAEALAGAGYNSVAAMKAGLNEKLEGVKTLLASEAQVQAGYDEIVKQEENLVQAERQLAQAKAGWDALIAQGVIDGNGNLLITEAMVQAGMISAEEYAAVKEQVTVLSPVMAGYDEQMAGLTAGKETLVSKKAEVSAVLTQINEVKAGNVQAQLEEGLAGIQALENGKAQLEATKTQLAAAKANLAQKEAEINNTKNEAGAQLENGLSQIEAGEEELQSQIDQFEDTRKEALDQASVSDKITIDMVSKILAAQNFSMPAGYVTEDGIDYLVRVGDKITDIGELGNLVLFDLGIEGEEPVRLSDVADIFMSDNSAETYAKMNGNQAVMLSVEKQPTYATATVSETVSKKFDALSEENPEVHFTMLSDQGDYIHMVVDSVLENLLFGALLAIIILLLFLKDIKPTVVIAFSIPLSVVVAIVLMYFSGVTLNIISLSGLAVGVGMLVDNSVVVIENIYRLRNKGISAVQAAVSGTVQVAGAITASTLTTVCVFLPIVFVKGMARELFTDMALTIAYSLLASLIVAMTLVPMMSSKLLKKEMKSEKHPWFDVIVDGYERILRLGLKFKPAVILLSVILLVVSIVAALSRGTSLMPSMDSTQVSVSMQMPEGATDQETMDMADEVLARIARIEDVENVGAMIGGSQLTSLMGGSGSGSVSMYAILKEDKKHSSAQIADQINEVCEDLDCEVTASGSSMDISALSGSGVSINVVGQELDTLQELAKKAAEVLESVEGTTEINDGMDDPTPQISISIDKEKAMLQGVTVAQAYMDLQSSLSSESDATTLSQSGKDYSVVVSEKEAGDMTRESIENYQFTVTGTDGEEKVIVLKDIATISDSESMSSINRNNQNRYITVSAAIADGYNVGLVSQDVERAFEDFEMPDGYRLEFAGENETIMESMIEMIKMLLMAVAFIYLIMVAQFQSLKSPFIVMFTIPLAFTGGFLGLYLTGNEVSVIAVLGFIMLSGIIVNNGIVLVDYINQLRLDGADKREAIIEAGRTRMRPILITALTTIFGLSTMAMGMGMGADMMQPIAIVTIGGLLYATLMTLFVIPVLYDVMNRKEMKKIDEKELEVLDE